MRNPFFQLGHILQHGKSMKAVMTTYFERNKLNITVDNKTHPGPHSVVGGGLPTEAADLAGDEGPSGCGGLRFSGSFDRRRRLWPAATATKVNWRPTTVQQQV